MQRCRKCRKIRESCDFIKYDHTSNDSEPGDSGALLVTKPNPDGEFEGIAAVLGELDIRGEEQLQEKEILAISFQHQLQYIKNTFNIELHWSVTTAVRR